MNAPPRPPGTSPYRESGDNEVRKEWREKILELARVLNDAPPTAAARWDEVCERIIGEMWQAVRQMDQTRLHFLIRAYERHLFEKVQAHYACALVHRRARVASVEPGTLPKTG